MKQTAMYKQENHIGIKNKLTLHTKSTQLSGEKKLYMK